MTIPSNTSRGDPHASDIPLWDGHATKVTISGAATLAFYEKTVTPPAYEGGDPIDTTTMHNVKWRTKAPRTLIELTDMVITAAYDPILLQSEAGGLQNLINSRRTITVTFSDGTWQAFYGYLKSFAPQEITEGAQPEAQLTFVATNWDISGGVEAGPEENETSGT